MINRRTTQYDQLLQGLQKTDPRLYDVLKQMSRDVVSILDVVDPVRTIVQHEDLTKGGPGPPDLFTVAYTERAVTFTWHSSDDHVRYFELKKGTDWDTAEFILRTPSLTASIPPLPVGTYTYLLKTLSESFAESRDYMSLTFTIDPVGAPTVTVQAVDNNVTISWTEPFHVFELDHYNVYKQATKIAEVKATYLIRIETIGGRLNYAVEAVDISGNIGPKGYGSATVRNPPDYVLNGIFASSLNGTLTNAYLENGKVVACVDLAETYQDHFDSKSWASPQDQIDDGYTRFIQENLLTGSYDETHDYGSVQDACTVTYDFVKEIFDGCTDVDVVIHTYHKVLPGGGGWTGPVDGNVIVIPAFRFLQTVLEFTGTDADSMVAISNLTVRRDIKLETDAGSISAVSTDTGGTTVSFNKEFSLVHSVVATPQGTGDVKAVIDFGGGLYPTDFKVLCFDTAGTRVSATVYWVARGTT